MKLVAITRVKNEIDIVEAFVRHHAGYFDKLIIVDDGSSDGTYELLRSLQESGLPIVIMREPTIGYFQSRQMTHLLRIATERFGADWVVPLDVDEFVEPPDGLTLAQVLAPLRGNLTVAWNNFAWTPEADANGELNPVIRLTERMRRRDDMNKVIVAADFISGLDAELIQGNHEIHVNGMPLPSETLASVNLCHYPIRSPVQYAAKIAVGYLQYAATPGWNRELGFHYIEPFRLLCSDPDLLIPRMIDDSRRYSLKDGTAFSNESSREPLRYRGGPLQLTPKRERLLSNVLHYAKTIAARLADTEMLLSEETKARARDDAASASLRAEREQIKNELRVARANYDDAEARAAAAEAAKARARARAHRAEAWAHNVTRAPGWRLMNSVQRLLGKRPPTPLGKPNRSKSKST